MHALHRILVYIPDVSNIDSFAKEEQKIAIRSYAEDETEDYYMQAFDWRETDCAGRWSDEYPEQVYFAVDDPEWFKAELEKVKELQENEIQRHLEVIKEIVGDDLDLILEANSFLTYILLKLGELTYGRYNFDSLFFNVSDDSARIVDSDITAIMAEPEEWALVFFDYHY